MKAFAPMFATLVSLMIAGSAQAMLQPDGTFVPGQCGEQKYTADEQQAPVTIQAVCIGHIQGDSAQAVQFRMSDNSSKLFRVHSTANLLVALRSGNIKSMYYLVGENGEQATMRVIQTHEGHIESLSGKLENIPYLVPQLQQMFTIQNF